jgi:putative transposase
LFGLTIWWNLNILRDKELVGQLWAKGYDVGRDRVRRLMRRKGVEALYVKPRLSLAHPVHLKYPYLLRGLEIARANFVGPAI